MAVGVEPGLAASMGTSIRSTDTRPSIGADSGYRRRPAKDAEPRFRERPTRDAGSEFRGSPTRSVCLGLTRGNAIVAVSDTGLMKPLRATEPRSRLW